MTTYRFIRIALTALTFSVFALGVTTSLGQRADAQTGRTVKKKKKKGATTAEFPTTSQKSQMQSKLGDTITTMSGLRYIDYEIGTGRKVELKMKIRVDYAGYLTDGKIFDTSLEEVAKKNGFSRGGYPYEPFEVVIGSGQVIRGWEEGLTTNINVGGRRRLIIPPELGWGARGTGIIPPNATVIFDVHMLSAE